MTTAIKSPAALFEGNASVEELVVPASLLACCARRIPVTVVTVKFDPLLAAPLTVTTTSPVVAPFGTGAAMLVALQLVGVAAMPLNVTVLVPWLAPKFVPVTVTGVAIGPKIGLRLLIVGVGRTVKFIPLL